LEHLYDYGLFLAQALTVVVAILLVAGGLAAAAQRRRHHGSEGQLEVHKLNERYQDLRDSLRHGVLDKAAWKAEHKARRKREKAEAKARKKQLKKSGDEAPEAEGSERKRLYVLDFDGDIRADASENLREEVSALLPEIRPGDEILLRLESPGGLVHGYGLAASQLRRITEAGVPLTVAVDKVAASGGYMMACVAPKIIAAPFAVIGSIGVVAQVPNFHRLLKKHDVDVEVLTAGRYKRTLTLFGENTEEGRAKFIEDLETTHQLFKAFVAENRPGLDIDKVATGEIWYGSDALREGLVDAVETSDAWIQARLADWDVFQVAYVERKPWQEKLGLAAEGAMERLSLKLWHKRGSDLFR
tara:strand:- start:29078 stop:30151 length:1074 start_codon:yes stop_codon:yes gene_type:complete